MERNYHEIDMRTGKHLHVFSLLPPPRNFILERIESLRSSPDPQSGWLRDRLNEIASDQGLYSYKRGAQINEKVRLLKDLAEDGLTVDEYADFLFFDFRMVAGDTHVDVIAVQQSPILDGADDREFIGMFRKMGEAATRLWNRGASADDFVQSIDSGWSKRLALRKARGLADYLLKFKREVFPDGHQ